MALHLETPLIESRPLSLASERSIWLKMDALQPSGSFKIRGVGAACEHHARNGKRRFVSSSGGNAGMAVAYAGRRLSIPVSVFVPETTTERAKALIRQEGAEVIVHGGAWDEANARALASVDAETAFIHPFDDPLLWAGHATMIDEVVRSGLSFDAVALSVGGGGLLSGVAEGLERNGLRDIPIITAETEGTASLVASVKAGTLVELPSVTGVATSLGARKVCEQAFEISQTRPVECVVVNDQSAVDACIRFLDDHRVLVEPACGAALAIAYGHAGQLLRFERVLIIVCGGATTTVERLQAWQA
ncbi:pyridoxal-phosphate dependent enzyme [Ensifer adhaerens]|uniref:pyridoxal-phosphate dependent enzyme n=1 Tax=Ensifer adhaerens TaxID=106592 RepID=UPI001CC00F4E|nr:pyridoxal-phosphate dependent enzyme [Ensifer adhaerens]MBZ7922324.1 pyridoxal-phosphate dependent enzyme [Ensifer adhaerens]UAX90961.1 pyridoxal-phosphate dependent enzyme [Ensifer adhaerens]UAX98590.1 pyridoxal-phosphate dependent enzyme [Ensifer adhaerens]UAY05971.1 pyridoxal-phosphate dependent enzyme [Ensifer adhaerens]